MGYRSEVCLIVQTNEVSKENAKVWSMLWAEARNKPECALFIKDVDERADLGHITGGLDMANQCMRLEWHDVKWYETYEGVQSVEAFVNLVSEYIGEGEGENQQPISMCYMQSGENDDDISIRSEGDYGHELGYLYSGYEIASETRYQ